jgi:MFS family permease
VNGRWCLQPRRIRQSSGRRKAGSSLSAAGILGWVLDAFDFFIMVFLFDTLAGRFHVSKASVVYTLTLTLAMRPLGALFFGCAADRFGRKAPADMFVFSTSRSLTVLSGLAPNYIFFVVCRALYGVGMGGYWGIGASYAMESSPRRFRGVLSGMMQAGYPMGYSAGRGGDADVGTILWLEGCLLCGRSGGLVDCGADAHGAGVGSVEADIGRVHGNDLLRR